MKNNTNLEAIKIDSIDDVATYFVCSEDAEGHEFFKFKDKDYTGTVEITKNGAIALGKSWVGLFEKTKVSRVIANETSVVTSMREMFRESMATSLDLRNLNTSSVTDMRGMFQESMATKIDLSKFDTSNVIDMSFMFYNSKANTIDLSSFDTSNVTDMIGMFEGSNIKRIFVKTENDANRIQANTNKILNLTVKKPEELEIDNLETISDDMLDTEIIKNL